LVKVNNLASILPSTESGPTLTLQREHSKKTCKHPTLTYEYVREQD